MYPFRKIEEKWQKRWKELNLYSTAEEPDRKFYLLEMFPYPSGDLHMGHLRNYVIGDVVARYKLLQGYDLLHPFGWDAFGLPAEEAAIKRGVDPQTWTMNNIAISRSTLKLMGVSYDWEREITTCLPDYYKWTQWIFLKLYERGLAYRKKAFVNWCPGCQTVLANEQVEDGSCWRCKSEVRKKELTQWFFKITEYAERLLKDIDKLTHWPENVKALQRNWIGKSEGLKIRFDIEGGGSFEVFTTRPDTIFGVTFVSVAPEHPLAKELVKGMDRETEVLDYIDKALLLPEVERASTVREKTGVFTGRYAVNLFSGEKVQIWVADYVLAHYGTGIVMGVPAHDQRDFEFAKKYNIPIKVVINPPGEELDPDTMECAYENEGVMVNSGEFTGMPSSDGISAISDYAERKGIGIREVNYRLRDWLISRQRYWGAPIPMIHCPKCGIVPVPEGDLPVLLPPVEKVDFTPKGTSPLGSVEEFINTTCPKCGSPAKRDPDTMDTFVDSSWYHLRYIDPKNDTEPFSKEKAKIWFPIDLYIGGVEHATGHLIYFRFITKVLYDAGYLPYDEPTPALFNQGMIMDENGEVMSKSKGNAVPVGPFVEKMGADTARGTILFIGPPDKDAIWSQQSVSGVNRFLNRVYRLVSENLDAIVEGLKVEIRPDRFSEEDKFLWRALNRTIKRVTDDIEDMGLNTAIAGLMEFVNELYRYPDRGDVFAHCIERFCLLLAPFAPHLAEELWEMIGRSKGSIFKESWPTYDPEWLEEDLITIVVQVNGRLRGEFKIAKNTPREEVIARAKGLQAIQKWLDGKEVLREIYVPEKLVNFVVR